MLPVTIAAVGEAMLRLAGEQCEGVRLHPLCTRRYLEEVCLPHISEGMRRGGRQRRHFDVHGGGFVATGPDEARMRRAMDWVRSRVALYASTRTYRPILALHGLEELGLKLHSMTAQGRWMEMPAEISDDVVRLFAACGTYDRIAAEIEQRFRAADSIEIMLPSDYESGPVRELLTEVRRIPQTFEGFATS
jgi:alkanesulfonate monooxygenase SsuD/methylene tetrahydromethanopterin reductase-like flavin-dependent oxidoreductase (luciferase family)